MRQRHLSMALSRLPPHPRRDVDLEQYATDGGVAARWLTAIRDRGDFALPSRPGEDGGPDAGAHVVDLGAGNGILGIGALLCGAATATLIECDPLVCDSARAAADLADLADRVNVIEDSVAGQWDAEWRWQAGREPEDPTVAILNPPWGRQRERADRPFIDAALASPVRVVHLLHSAEAMHIEGVAGAAGWEAERWLEDDLPLPATYHHHAQRRGSTRCAMWRLTRA